MLVIASEAHRAHAALELDDGAMGPSVESPERADIISGALRAASHDFVVPDAVDLGLLRRVHAGEYVDFLATAWDRWVVEGKTAPSAMGLMWPTRGFRSVCPDDIVGALGHYSFTADTSIVAGTFSAATGAVAIATTAADRMLDTSAPTYGLCRPPGHHAMVDQFGGYCFFNNAAVAAQRLRDRGANRVGIIDIDYHHGNGTESIFLDRGDVVFVSLHADPRDEFPWFAGFADERGTGSGRGANLNLPLPKGATSGAWFSALETALRFLTSARLDALVVSLGVDAYEHDPLGTFALTTSDFAQAGDWIRSLGLATVIVQEGGYAVETLGANVVAFLDRWA
ncbi:MAG: histone deacetylase family protein [Ilumatobacter sp.]|nr:histone deacetylase family protein [Ilumatobacter sp.]